MYIIDTRPRVSRTIELIGKKNQLTDEYFIFIQINAVANRAAGKGYENEDYYSNIQFKFCPIENIHIMRSSLQKLLESNFIFDRIFQMNIHKNSLIFKCPKWKTQQWISISMV